MKNTPFRIIRVAIASLVLLSLTLFFFDFSGFIPMNVAKLADIQLIPSILSSGFLVFAILVASTFLFGRLYCSIICPLGILQDLIAWVERRFSRTFSFFNAKKEKKAPKPDVNTFADNKNQKNSAPVAKASPKRRIFNRDYRFRKNPRMLRLLFLATALLSFPLGGCYFGLLEPYGIFGRIATNVFKPVYVVLNNLLVPIGAAFKNYSLYYIEVRPESWAAFVVGVLSFLVLIAFSARFGRLYCNSICPVGTFLGLISRFSFLKIRIDPARCAGCGLCVKACKSSCVDVEKRSVDASRCVVCFDCLGACRKGAIKFRPGKRAALALPNDTNSAAPSKLAREQIQNPRSCQNAQVSQLSQKAENSLENRRLQQEIQRFDRGKREFLTLAVVATSAAVARAAFAADEEKLPANAGDAAPTSDGNAASSSAKAKPVDYGRTPFKRENLITPPGSISKTNFQNRCVACHLCVAKCPSKILKPAGLENGLRGFMQPRVDFARGFCNFDCLICGEVCPTGAIKPLTLEEKHLVQPGKVIFIKQNCIVYAKNESCGACSEHCPTQAVKMVPYGAKGLTIPETTPDLCVGCGACEHICPARPYHAIYIEGNTVHLQAKPIPKQETKVIENPDFGF